MSVEGLELRVEGLELRVGCGVLSPLWKRGCRPQTAGDLKDGEMSIRIVMRGEYK